MRINQIIEDAVEFIREARDEADDLGDRILFFCAFLLIGISIIFFVFLFCMLAFTFPRVVIPIYFSVFILWQGYKRL